jgi:putative transposase
VGRGLPKPRGTALRRGLGKPPSLVRSRNGACLSPVFFLNLTHCLPRFLLPSVPVKFFDPYSEIHVTQNRLPHWQQAAATYFLTFRLADSLPKSLLEAWRDEREAWLKLRPTPLSSGDEAEYHRLFSSKIDQWLDAGHGDCLLASPSVQEIVTDALCHFDRDRYELASWVIMPNHLHVCLILHPDWKLEKIIFTWKRRTAGSINQHRGTSGPVWMPDYFDRLIRDRSHFENVIRYIRRNPEKARLGAKRYRLWESEIAKDVV